MEMSVTLDPPGTEKRCKLKERACAGPWSAGPNTGDSDGWSDEVVALGWEGNEECGGEDGGECHQYGEE